LEATKKQECSPTTAMEDYQRKDALKLRVNYQPEDPCKRECGDREAGSRRKKRPGGKEFVRRASKGTEQKRDPQGPCGGWIDKGGTGSFTERRASKCREESGGSCRHKERREVFKKMQGFAGERAETEKWKGTATKGKGGWAIKKPEKAAWKKVGPLAGARPALLLSEKEDAIKGRPRERSVSRKGAKVTIATSGVTRTRDLREKRNEETHQNRKGGRTRERKNDRESTQPSA